MEKYRPDLVICLAGINDFRSLLLKLPPGQSQRAQFDQVIEVMMNGGFMEFIKSVVIRYFRTRYRWINDLILSVKRLKSGKPNRIEISDKSSTLQSVPKNAADEYVAHFQHVSQLMNSVLTARGIPFINAIQPCLGYGDKPLNPYESEMSQLHKNREPEYFNLLKSFYDVLIRKLRTETQGKTGIFLDCTAVFENEKRQIFVDHAHMGDRGNQIIGHYLGSQILPLLSK